AYGLAWMALAYAPVANFLFPIGVVVAERTQYLPSVGLALAVAGLARNLRGRALGLVVGAMAVAGGARTALRVPVWRSNMSLTLSILEDSLRSYVGPMIMATLYLDQARPATAFAAASRAPLPPARAWSSYGPFGTAGRGTTSRSSTRTPSSTHPVHCGVPSPPRIGLTHSVAGCTGRSRSRATPWIGSLGPRRGFTESICCGMPRRASRLPCWRDAGAAIAQRWSPA